MLGQLFLYSSFDITVSLEQLVLLVLPQVPVPVLPQVPVLAFQLQLPVSALLSFCSQLLQTIR